MNLDRSIRLMGCAALLVAATLPAMAQGIPNRGRSIQFSDPRVEVVTSNLNEAAISKKISLRKIDEQFKAPFDLFDAQNTGIGSQIDPGSSYRPPVLSTKSLREILEKRKEQEQWIFGSPEELEAQRLTAERMLGLTEYDETGMNRESQHSPLQKYWDRIERERQGQTNRVSGDVSTEKTDLEIKDQAKAMFGLADLRRLDGNDQSGLMETTPTAVTPGLTSPLFQEVSPLRSSSGLFSQPNTPTAFGLPQKNDASLNRMNDFKQLFETRPISPISTYSPPSSVSSLNTFTESSKSPLSQWNSPAAASSLSSFSSLNPSRSTLSPSAPSLAPTTSPLFQQPARTLPTTGFQMPKRSF
jgi:hypothetical protein